MERVIIKTDLFNICKRLKSINKKYFLVLNKNKNQYEVHFKRTGNTLELVLPFNKLDKRTVDYVLKTQICNREKIIKEIDDYNNKLERDKTKQIKENILAKI